MTPIDATLLAGLASGFAVIGIVLFRMADDKKRAMDGDADSTYRVIRKRVLEPALLSIIESRRGRFKIMDTFADPDVVMKLEAHKRALFDYNESGSRRGAVSAAMGLACRAPFLTAGAVYLVLGADALAARLAPIDVPSLGATAAGWSATALGAAVVVCALGKYHAEDGARRLEMRKIRSGLS